MYNLINSHVTVLLQAISQNHVTEYDWLIQNMNLCGTSQYQAKYKNYWRLNTARLSTNYCTTYFNELQEARSNIPSLGSLAQRLYNTSTHSNGRQSLQFSFTTKLIHMVSPSVPIYDSLVAAFYFFQEPDRKLSLQKRIDSLTKFHSFLFAEYKRILSNNLLATSISAFRQHFSPQQFTDEKVIDSLLWAYVGVLRKNGITNGSIEYR